VTAARPLSLYIHVPFCSLKCAYCDFNSYAGLDELIRPYDDALVQEIRLWGEALSRPRVATVFFGGGTPSLLPLAEVERVMAAVGDAFEVLAGAEVSLEANPGTVDPDYLRGLVELGVNRLSFGVQSFHDDELHALDRIHRAEEARAGYRWAREAGLRRVNLDLIYGLPGQPMERWRSTLDEAIGLGPEHLSLYALTVEEGTKLAHDVESGRVAGPDPDMQAAMYEWSMERLERAGYRQYEISNWAVPGQECRHNLVYWRNGEWLGLGAGAHSHWGSGRGVHGYRFANAYSPKRYMELVRETAEAGVDRGGPAKTIGSMRQVTFVERQERETAMSDTAILALRLNEGLDVPAFERRFGATVEAAYGAAVSELMALGLLEREDGRLRLTARGRLLANEVFVRLLPD